MPRRAVLPVSYLVRAWVSGATPDGMAQVRYIVERIDTPPQRRAFDSFAAVVAYLQAELAAEELGSCGPAEHPE